MKRILLLVLIILSVKIQAQWVQISTVGNNELRSVKFFNEFTGVLAGQGGIWRSTNSGVNWTHVWAIDDMNSFSFLTASIGLVAGNNGKVLKTTNGGLNWSYTNTTISENLYAIDWANATVCWTVGQGGKIMKSTNSGSSWYSQTNPISEDLKDLYMPDPGNGYIAGGTTRELFGSTINGGNNWVYPLNQEGFFINAMYCFPSFDKVILIGSNGRIRRSINFGNTWSIISSSATFTLNSVYFADLSTGYIAGDNGTILKSTNEGVNWSLQSSSSVNNLKSINFINPNTGWTVGTNGTVLRTGIPVGITNNNGVMSEEFHLSQNYPNPFNPETKISFNIKHNGLVKIDIFDVSGSKILSIINEYLHSGFHEITTNLSNLSSGIYFYCMSYSFENNYFFEQKKLVLIK